MQALLVLICLRKGETLVEFGAGFGVGLPVVVGLDLPWCLDCWEVMESYTVLLTFPGLLPVDGLPVSIAYRVASLGPDVTVRSCDPEPCL